MKTFNESQMLDPWQWCLSVFEKHELDSSTLADNVDAPRSTIRALYNGTTSNPSYPLLKKFIQFCVDLENGDWVKKSAPEDTFEKEPVEYDFL